MIKKKKEIDLNIDHILPPQALEVEEIVLGTIISDRNIFSEIIHELPEDCFYSPLHNKIFTACRKMFLHNEPIDHKTLLTELRKNEEINKDEILDYLFKLTNPIGSTANIRFHVKIVVEAFAKREVIRICREKITQAFDPSTDIFELFDSTDSEIQSCRDKIISQSKSFDWATQVNETVSIIEKLKLHQMKVSGIPTGNEKLDLTTGGWQKSDLIIMAGRPGSGKTTRALNFIKTACINDCGTILFSLEMKDKQIVRKFLNEQSQIFGNKLMTGEISDYQMILLKEAKEKIIQFPIYLDDTGSINTNHIRNVIKRRKKKQKVDFVVVDYLQLMTPIEKIKGRSRDTEVGSITTALKSIAKEFDVAMMVLSQLSRKCEERTDKRPILSDLRESGSIENDADIVIGEYRPSYYYQFAKDKDYANEPSMTEEQYKRISELHILKHRNGQTDKYIRENFYGEFSRFSETELEPILHEELN